MKTDSELRHDVEQALEWEPAIDERYIGVSVVDDVVTLTGHVSTFSERWKAERTVERVAGVRGVANKLEVRLKGERTDTEIAKDAVHALKADITVPADHITVKVDRGWVTLTGDVRWDFERRAAERAIRNLAGIVGITNLITIKPRIEPENVKQRIEETFKREAALDAQNITVTVSGGEVTLRGTVRSWLERYEAERAAGAAPGVTAVHNHITVETPAFAA